MTVVIRKPSVVDSQKKILNFSEARKHLGLNRVAMTNLMEAGVIPFKKVGKLFFFTRDELDQIHFKKEVRNEKN